MNDPVVTIAVPSYNQGKYLDETLASIFQQSIPLEVFVLDGGSTDNSLEIIKKWEHRLAGWRSRPDAGQAAAINEGVAKGGAPFVCWLNSDDWLLPGGLESLLNTLQAYPEVPAVYGRTWNYIQKSGVKHPVWVEPFSEKRLAFRCIISQPATLIRRTAWEAVGGLDPAFHYSMDYDLWWRLYRMFGPLQFVDAFLAVNRDHEETKTRSRRKLHYQESVAVVRRHYGRVPAKWWLSRPYAVWYRSIFG